MPNKKFILSIDQGTSSTKTLIFDEQGKAVAKGMEPLYTIYFNDGFVEQDPETIYQNVLASVKKCLQQFVENGFSKNDITAIGISNQRETFVVWDEDGKPLHNAVVWQCKRSVLICERLKKQDLSNMVNEKTGLIIDPYFSATKLIWLKENNPAITSSIKNGEACFGTIDTWLLYKLTKGAAYKTDYTNASRTLMFNLHTLQWDEELIDAFGLTGIQLPALQSSSSLFGETTIGGLLENRLPVSAMIGDSHSAAFGEGCFDAGTAKATLGTGCSILMNVGNKPVQSTNGMVSTICWSTEHEINYALEGVIVSCGATIEWLKNELHFFTDSRETEAMATAVPDNGGVYLVPAFSGLGSPHWQMDRRASISGLTFGTTKNHIVRAALETIPYQIKDVITAMEKDAGISLKELMADGGITANQFVMQFIASLLNKNVAGIGMPDVSALGAGLLAGLQAGVYADMDVLRTLNTDKKYFTPADTATTGKNYEGWQKAIAAG
ncbi:MAG: glycerol kinase GlpK [Bacteroidota bacterium]